MKKIKNLTLITAMAFFANSSFAQMDDAKMC